MSRIKIVAIVLIAAGVLGLIYGPQDRLARGIGEGQGNRQHTDLVGVGAIVVGIILLVARRQSG